MISLLRRLSAAPRGCGASLKSASTHSLAVLGGGQAAQLRAVVVDEDQDQALQTCPAGIVFYEKRRFARQCAATGHKVPHGLRASDQRSQAALLRNPRKSDNATPNTAKGAVLVWVRATTCRSRPA